MPGGQREEGLREEKRSAAAVDQVVLCLRVHATSFICKLLPHSTHFFALLFLSTVW